MLYVPLQFRAYENQGLLDTGAIKSAMSENELRRILQAHPAAQLEDYPAPDFKVQIANGSIVPVRKQLFLRFFIGVKVFEETFMILPRMGNILIGMSFFKKYSVTLDLANNIVRFPEITLQLRPQNGKFKLQMLELRTSHKTTIPPRQPSGSRKGHRPCNRHGGSVPGIRTKDGIAGIPIDVRNKRPAEPCPNHQLLGPHNNNTPTHNSCSLSHFNPKPSKERSTNDKRATDPHFEVSR